ncbi:hypothetical protein, partial [Proteus mirabilis]|uniref:hypothetical protein n=1 Tax=Proteus mirabilis TaxID=584 RepID=UPI0019547D99
YGTSSIALAMGSVTVPKVKRFAAKDATLTLRFHRAMLVWMLERALTDKEFAGRRAQWMVLE